MVKVKPLATAQSNFTNSAGTAAQRYREAAPSIEWRTPSEGGQDLYVQRMQDPNVLARRLSGIQNVSDTEFRNAVITKGAPVLQSRMAAAGPKWGTRWSPFRTALEGLTLPARVADPMQNIDNRLKPVVQTMIDTKEQISG